MLLAAAGVPAAHAVHVGDDPRADVEGARRAGIRPVWLNRSGAAWPESIEAPDWTIGSLAELVKLLCESA